MKKNSLNELLDATDFSLLDKIQRDGRISNSKLAQQINLSDTPCWRRWKRLEDEGFISGYRTLLDRRKLGYDVIAFVQVSFERHEVELTDHFEQQVQALEWILMCHNITGDADYLLQVVARDLDQFSDQLTALRRIPGVRSLQSGISVREIKADMALPLG
ncbi:Lrp/AsnC family transcriptional regulator [Marinobacterium arenosum]|uniref:Lrp/AsnC family transcriptional regulator n=1 Tax=Marinobacterium arenosum TaxID=2862496 RepID=UPI001C989F7D|nr:Lrp/AsnC family transcriptional regulator [Marinobacterium arenosum]MBY4678591.1 Lrp/AsnC family transcriptional regulator [Marinobacterium arenosum]